MWWPGGSGRGGWSCTEGGWSGVQCGQSSGAGGAVWRLQQAEGGHLTHQRHDPPEERGEGQRPAQGHQRLVWSFSRWYLVDNDSGERWNFILHCATDVWWHLICTYLTFLIFYLYIRFVNIYDSNVFFIFLQMKSSRLRSGSRTCSCPSMNALSPHRAEQMWKHPCKGSL